jgi:hypothetical protein
MTARHDDPLDLLVDAILQSYGQLALVIEHMLRTRSSREPLDVVLRGVLRDVLAPVAERHGDIDLAVAAEVLTRATDTIGTELYLVPVEELRRPGCGPRDAPEAAA